MKVFFYSLTALTLAATLSSPAFADDDDDKPGKGNRRPRSVDVCIDPATGFHLDDSDVIVGPTAGDGFVATGKIFPGGTIPAGGFASCDNIFARPIGKFFARGRLLEALPARAHKDVAYVDWQFRLHGVGALDTTGPVRSAATYPQTIIGATGRLAPLADGNKREAIVKALNRSGFQFRLLLPK